MSLSSTDAPLEIRAAEAFRAFLAQVTGLTAFDWRRADDPRDRPLPIGVVMVSNLRQEWAGSDEFSGVLQVMYASGKDPDGDADGVDAEDVDLLANQTAHMAIVALISNALKDQGAMREHLNEGAAVRPVTDFHFYCSLDHEEPGTEREGSCWNTEFRRKVVIARVDYAE